ncbi:Gcp-like domain [Phytophthora cactorum]|nr:Gcp-like domain [Phytophthora cactorum]
MSGTTLLSDFHPSRCVTCGVPYISLICVNNAAAGNSAALAAAAARHASYMLVLRPAAAVLDQNGRVLSSVISSQWELNAKWRGLSFGLENLQQLSAVAVTSGPDLLRVWMGCGQRAKICLDNPNRVSADQPPGGPRSSVTICHKYLETPRPEFPFVVLLVSGGHCCLVLAKGLGDYELLGNTLDDSIGEAYDKVARMLDITASAMLREVKKRKAVDQLITRTRRACQWSKDRLGDNFTSLVVAAVWHPTSISETACQAAAEEEGVVAVFPPAKYCTDNGVMIAWAGLERYAKGMRSDPESARYQPRWPLETCSHSNVGGFSASAIEERKHY